MIDEKKLIEERPEWLNPDCVGSEEYNKGWNACNKYWCNTIKRQPKVGEWIPCSERLPHEDDFPEQHYRILASCTDGIVRNATIKSLLENKENLSCLGQPFFYTAWKPLPAPFRDKE